MIKRSMVTQQLHQKEIISISKDKRSFWESKVLKYFKGRGNDFFPGYAVQVKHEALTRKQNHNPFPMKPILLMNYSKNSFIVKIKN